MRLDFLTKIYLPFEEILEILLFIIQNFLFFIGPCAIIALISVGLRVIVVQSITMDNKMPHWCVLIFSKTLHSGKTSHKIHSRALIYYSVKQNRIKQFLLSFPQRVVKYNVVDNRIMGIFRVVTSSVYTFVHVFDGVVLRRLGVGYNCIGFYAVVFFI